MEKNRQNGLIVYINHHFLDMYKQFVQFQLYSTFD